MVRRSSLLLLLLVTLFAVFTLAACGGGGGSSTPPPQPSTAPTLSGINPSHGAPGASVTLTGTNLSGATAVAFHGQAAFSFSVSSDTQILAVVPSAATTGAIEVTTPKGTAASASFTVDAPLPPVLTAFAPGALSAGAVVTLTGSHFVGATRVQFNGADAASFTVTSDAQIQATAPVGLSAGAITVTTPGGTAVSPTPYVVVSGLQVLMNTGFEQASPLIWQGDTGIIQGTPSGSSSTVPHSGALFAWLGGYGTAASDQITQDFYIPATAQSATATFYVKILTSETGGAAKDTFTVEALSASNAPLGTLLTKSNLDAGSYAPFTVDLQPYKGQVVRLSFRSQEDGQNATSFLLDDVVANIAVPAASDLKPLITSFTPTSGVAGEVTVQISGGNFFGLSSVTIGGAAAAYTLTDGTSLRAVVAAGAAAGSAPITLVNAQGTGTSATPFTVAYGVPTVTGVNPTQGPIGTPVVITGTYLGYPGTTVTLNGLAITPATQTATQITFTIPAGATSGSLVVTTPGGSVPRTFTVNTASTTLDLHVDQVQLTQSTQTLNNSVPIVAGKPGLVRVFVLANQGNTATPAVQVTLLNGGVPVAGYPKSILSPGSAVPLALDESSLAASWNLAIPASDLTTPNGAGYSIQAVVDPGSAVPEADESNNALTVALSGGTVPAFKTTIFPVVLSSGTGGVSAANQAEWVARLAKMYPVASVDVAVGASFTGSVSTLGADGTGWDVLLNDLTAKHLADAVSDRYYFGALNVGYSSGVAGLGWVPPLPTSSFKYRTAIGWDKTGYSDGGNFPEVFAHETGHNMGRHHSPCGGAASPDPDYPYSGALIGVWGYDTVLNQLYSPLLYKDIMAYCKPNWVSDYVYRKIFDFRGASGGFLEVGAEDAPLPKNQAEARECLLVRGIVRQDGAVVWLPSFRTRALPSALPSEGEYTLEGLDQEGRRLFSAPLDLMELGCWPKGNDRHFVMALPLDATALDGLARLEVLKARRVMTSARPVSTAARVVAAAPEARRLDRSRIRLTWDAAIYPAALVRDAESGEVVAILKGGSQDLSTSARTLDLVLSDGVTGPTHRLTPVE